jgi:tRNA dimethylallyltransferase
VKLFPKLLVIAGPTASGKTSLSIELALKFNGEIISADSRQVFKGLDIGTGKVKEYEKCGVPHHLIDILNPGQKYSVYQFQKDCLELIDEITASERVPIIVGGTGLYIESIVEQYRFNDQDKKSTKKLGLRLNTLVINLLPDREVIKNNIQERLLERWNNQNMLGEVENLIKAGADKSWLKSLGLEYKYITEYIDGEFEDEEAMLTKLNTEIWRFAKRQITFNKRWEYANEIKSSAEAIKVVKEFLI